MVTEDWSGWHLNLLCEQFWATQLCLKPFLENFVFTFGGYDSGKNELAIEVGIHNEGDLEIFGTDDVLKNWYFYPYAYFLWETIIEWKFNEIWIQFIETSILEFRQHWCILWQASRNRTDLCLYIILEQMEQRKSWFSISAHSSDSWT